MKGKTAFFLFKTLSFILVLSLLGMGNLFAGETKEDKNPVVETKEDKNVTASNSTGEGIKEDPPVSRCCSTCPAGAPNSCSTLMESKKSATASSSTATGNVSTGTN